MSFEGLSNSSGKHPKKPKWSLIRHLYDESNKTRSKGEKIGDCIEYLRKPFIRSIDTERLKKEKDAREKTRQNFVDRYKQVKQVINLINSCPELVPEMEVRELAKLHQNTRQLLMNVGELFPEGAKANIETFLKENQKGMQDAREEMDNYAFGPYSQLAVELMHKRLQEVAAFAQHLQDSGITSMEALERNLKNRLAKIEERVRQKRNKTRKNFIDCYKQVKHIDGALTSLVNTYESFPELGLEMGMSKLADLYQSTRQLLTNVGELVSDEQFPEEAKTNIETFLKENQKGMQAARKEMDDYKFGPYSLQTVNPMDKLLEKVAAFAQHLQDSGITSVEALEQNLKDRLGQIKQRALEKFQADSKLFDENYKPLIQLRRAIWIIEELKKPVDDLSVDQLQQMQKYASDLQGLPSGPQSVMDFVNAQKSRLHNVIGEIEKAGWIEDEEVKKAVKETMDKWIKERFVPVPGEAKHSTLDQIKNDLKELSSQNLENVIKTTDAKLGVVSNDPDLASSEDVRKYVRTCREALEAAKSYQGQDEVTIAGLVERFRALKVANTQLDSLAQVDKLIKDRIQEDVNRLSEEVKDIKRFQPEPFSSRNFGIADVLNPERRVEDFQRALKQKNQPEAIYRVLQSLQCEPKAIEKFENEIWKKYKKTLETILRDHFGKPKDRARLEHALQLINKGDQGVGQAIRPLPDLEGQPLVSKLCQVLGDISERIHQALHPSDGVSKPKDVCNMLSIFDRNPDLVSELEDAYKNTSGNTNRTDLRSAIAQKLSGESLLLAQQLMGDQVSEKKQVSQDRATRLAKMLLIYHELLSVAERLNVALADPTLKPETVYAILTPFRRNTKLWCKLGDIYQKRYKMDLRSSIAAKLQGDSLIYARYLIGDKVLEENIGDYENLLQFHKALSGVTFDRDDGMSIPVPYDSPINSEPESHIMCQVLKGIGCRSKKIFALYLRKNDSGGKEPNLHVCTDFAPDMLSGQAPTVTLGYRMATLVEVETPFGVREFVIDPSLSDCPLTVENWTAKMSPDVFKRISVADFKAELDTEAQFNPTFPYPVGPHLFETSRNYYRLPTSNDIRRLEDLEANPDNKSINDSTALVTYNKDGMTTIANKAEWAPYFIMANFIRKNMHSINNEASAKKFLNTIAKGFLKDVSTFHSIKNTNFSSAYPNLYQDLTHIVKTHISASIAESFEKLLSGDSALSGAKRDQDIFSADSVHDIESDIRMRADQSSDTRKAEDVESSKDVKDPEEALQKEVDRWPLETIHIERIQRPIFLRDCKMADVLDFKQLVDDFDAALEPGKQPEDLYRVLYPLLREQEAIDKLDNAYKGKHGKTLETALKDHLGQIGDSAQLEYALQLVNKGDSEAVEAIKRLPANPSEDELDEVAKRIHQALKGPNPQPKVVYAALMSFERNTELLCKLDERYNDKFQTGLKSHIEDTLKENLKAKDYALFLIGDQAMEKQEMSEYEAMRLWKVVQRLTFDRGDGVRVPVPYDHPREGCGSRAHAIAHALKEMGYASEKIFVQSLRLNEHKQKVDDLHVYTDLAPDMPSDQKPGLAWSNHIACCIQIKTEAGGNELLVFDPSLSARPLTMKNWMSKMGKDSYELISLKDYSTRLAEEYQSDPAKPYQAGTFLLIAGNNFMGQPLTPDALACWLKDESIPGQNAFEDNRKEPMINNAKRVPYNRMARSIRKGLRKPTIQNADTFLAKLATEFLANVSEYRSSTNSAFSEAFSNLYKDLIEYIRTRVGEASSEDFRGHLSGESRIDV